jgi:hypothetical protein
MIAPAASATRLRGHFQVEFPSEELFAAEDETDWEEWVEFSGRRENQTDAAKGLWRYAYDHQYRAI